MKVILFFLRGVPFLWLILFIVGSISLAIETDKNQVKLAGQALFPDEIYTSWLEVQQNQTLETEDKITATINTFFLIQYESWLRNALLDFGFLFEQDNEEAYECYAHERGRLYYSLALWQRYNNQLKHYESRPKYLEFTSGSEKAEVKVWPSARIIIKRYPDEVTESPLHMRTINLVLRKNRWLIRNIRSDSPVYNYHPRGTDFEKLVSTWDERERKAIAEGNARVAEMKNDPRMAKRLRRQYEDDLRQMQLEANREANRIELYNKISGTYKFDVDGKDMIVSFYTDGKYLLGRHEADIDGIILQRVERQDLHFEMRTPDKQFYEIQFIREETGEISKCELRKNGNVYTGLKLH